MRQSIINRFWPKVKVDQPDKCWEWKACKLPPCGYGLLSDVKGKSPLRAHRVSWEIHNGPIPKGLHVLHNCDNPSCVNPAHLAVGTQKDNIMAASSRGRLNPLSLNNLRPGAKGYRGAGPISNGERI